MAEGAGSEAAQNFNSESNFHVTIFRLAKMLTEVEKRSNRCKLSIFLQNL